MRPWAGQSFGHPYPVTGAPDTPAEATALGSAGLPGRGHGPELPPSTLLASFLLSSSAMESSSFLSNCQGGIRTVSTISTRTNIPARAWGAAQSGPEPGGNEDPGPPHAQVPVRPTGEAETRRAELSVLRPPRAPGSAPSTPPAPDTWGESPNPVASGEPTNQKPLPAPDAGHGKLQAETREGAGPRRRGSTTLLVARRHPARSVGLPSCAFGSWRGIPNVLSIAAREMLAKSKS